MNMTEVRQFLTSLRDSFRELETLPIPTIAVIDGAALGGGLEMALCCDMRVGGGNKKVKIGLVETKLAIIPGYVPYLIVVRWCCQFVIQRINKASIFVIIAISAGGTQRLPRLIGIPKAKELIYSSKILNSAAAKDIGMLIIGC